MSYECRLRLSLRHADGYSSLPWANLPTEQRLEQRQLTAQPLIDDLAQWLEKSPPLITPKSQLGRAMIYLHKQCGKLTVFLQSGNVPIHNNRAENKIRPFVIGRKNWMFNDSVKGAESSAAIYSLIETAKANDLAPDIYLRWLFNTLPNADTTSSKALRALLPYGVDPNIIVQSLADKALSGEVQIISPIRRSYEPIRRSYESRRTYRTSIPGSTTQGSL